MCVVVVFFFFFFWFFFFFGFFFFFCYFYLSIFVWFSISRKEAVLHALLSEEYLYLIVCYKAMLDLSE